MNSSQDAHNYLAGINCVDIVEISPGILIFCDWRGTIFSAKCEHLFALPGALFLFENRNRKIKTPQS
jgi:hypothetical protein